ncbi:3-keto-5-aminohexanoate cleavage protein [Microbacterium sp. ASV49]|uniref:3-keto-5-aminohexanoate cleavage protein n=1 Tax=Microbacterium candidum TaxID=3041922 RepID=A0ABT7N207_9MICO|nr:3-keto-5-aminohexanoate cleavage protein [Microbacterium sp. ASV49]MDL9980749.1 3-keto-5-aminohexanoate cleavage protein [Microbacterium sp. ASV49]
MNMNDKVIITVTVDCSMSYPGFDRMPAIDDVETVADEYIRAIDAGASLVHHHGVHRLEDTIQEDGRQLSRTDFQGWSDLTEAIRSERDAIIQFGIASARLEEKIELMKLGPDMMSYAFNVHDEYFRPDPAYPANEQYAIHPRSELEAFSAAALEHGVKPEIECFYSGAFWNLEYIREQGLLQDPVWATLFLGWPGGAWTPPTPDSLLHLAKHVPDNVNWNCSVMNSQQQWRILALAMSIGGHVRVGWEDNPYLPDGTPSRSNAELVEEVVKLARLMGREVATPDEAREIIGLPVRVAR